MDSLYHPGCNTKFRMRKPTVSYASVMHAVIQKAIVLDSSRHLRPFRTLAGWVRDFLVMKRKNTTRTHTA